MHGQGWPRREVQGLLKPADSTRADRVPARTARAATEGPGILDRPRASIEGRGTIYTPLELVDRVLAEAWRLVAPGPQITVCDPSCGDGSFLEGARRALAGVGVQDPDRQLFGVDRDPAAVAMARSRLPGARLVNAEALVGFDWEAFAPGGFDLVVGNPPFVRILHLRRHDPDLAEALTRRGSPYASASGSFDLYGPFLELAWRLARRAVAFVVPHRFFVTEYGRELRARFGSHVASILDLGDSQPFSGALTYPSVVVLEKCVRRTFAFERARAGGLADDRRAELPISQLAPDAWIPLLPPEMRIIAKLEEGAVPLFGQSASPAQKLFVGLQTPSNAVYRLKVVAERGERLLVTSRAELEPFEIETSVTRAFLMGADIRAFAVRDRGQRVIFPYETNERSPGPGQPCAGSVSALDLRSCAPLAAAYLDRHRLEFTGGKLLGTYRYPKNLAAFEQPKLLVGGVASRGRYAYDEAGRYYVAGGGDGGYSLVPGPGIDPWALLSVLASSPLDFYLQRHSALFSGQCYSYGRRFLHRLPVRHEVLSRELAEIGQALAGSGPARARILERELDATVAASYGLTSADLAIIAARVPERFPASR